MTSAEFLACCKMRGLSIAEIDEMNLGLVIDYIYKYDEYRNGKSNDEEEKPSYHGDNGVVQATQADFDRF